MFMKDFIDEILTEHTISLMEDNGIKDYVVVYPGRFQPMSRHHVATYKHLVDKFGKDKVWVASSNKQDKIKSPLDIKEKDLIAKKHGVKNFEFEVMPYVPKRILSKFNPKTTALIMITGKKDESRLGSFKRASKFSGLDNLVPFEDEKNPYMSYYIAPHKSVKTPWGELNGTLVRNVLSTPIKDEKKAKEISKMLLGWYDKKIFQLLQDKFSSIAEIDEDFIKEFLKSNHFKNLMKEISSTPGTRFSDVDDGRLGPWYAGMNDYMENVVGKAELYGMKIIDWMVKEDEVGTEYERFLGYIFPAGAQANNIDPEIDIDVEPDYDNEAGIVKQFPKTNKKHYKLYRQVMHDMAMRLGFEVLDYMDSSPWDIKPSKAKEIKDVSINEMLMLEGGAYGHMNHPFDDADISFSDLKQMITLGLQGNLNVEKKPTEKVDGFNLMITWKDGKMFVARNKTQIKNPLTASQLNNAWSDRPNNFRNAMKYALNDLEKAIGKLTQKQQNKIFLNGNGFMNLEILDPTTENVINYDVFKIIFHGTLEYKDGKVIGQVKDSGRILGGMLKQINQNIQSKYSLEPPKVLRIAKSQDYSIKQSKYITRLEKIKNKYNLKDTDKLIDYHYAYWESFLNTIATKNGWNMTNDILTGLIRRWATFDKSYRLDKKNIPDEDFLNWAKDFDKNDHGKAYKENMKELELLVLDWGNEILSNVENFISANPDRTIELVINKINKVKSEINKSDNINIINRFVNMIDRLEQIGGLENIVPSEGLVFQYKGKTYKITGSFAPINQIIGLLRF